MSLSFIHPVDIQSMSGSILGAVDTAINKTRKVSVHYGAHTLIMKER